jgi:hypothetical protein
VFGLESQPFGTVYVCPVCGDAWGKVEIDGCSYIPQRRHCPKHGPAYLLAWRDLYDYDDGNLHLPREVLAHDVAQYMRWNEDKPLDTILLCAGLKNY